jgi:hypothetical protein
VTGARMRFPRLRPVDREEAGAVKETGDGRLEVPPGGGAANSPYPDFDVARAEKWASDWDEKTRELVLHRVHEVPSYRFFSADEAALLEALCARLVPQQDRPAGQRIPIGQWIDDRLHRGEGYGYRYEEMPEDGPAYRGALAGFESTARSLFGTGFVELTAIQQDDVIRLVANGSPPGEPWTAVPARRFFQRFLGDVLTVYYAHPAAWAEIGFNGPASPRGHMRLDLGRRDPWEARERRPRSSVEIVRGAPGVSGGEGQAPTH